MDHQPNKIKHYYKPPISGGTEFDCKPPISQESCITQSKTLSIPSLLANSFIFPLYQTVSPPNYLGMAGTHKPSFSYSHPAPLSLSS